MKKSIFTFAMVAVATVSANAVYPYHTHHVFYKNAIEGASVDKTVALESQHHPTIFEPLLR